MLSGQTIKGKRANTFHQKGINPWWLFTHLSGHERACGVRLRPDIDCRYVLPPMPLVIGRLGTYCGRGEASHSTRALSPNLCAAGCPATWCVIIHRSSLLALNFPNRTGWGAPGKNGLGAHWLPRYATGCPTTATWQLHGLPGTHISRLPGAGLKLQPPKWYVRAPGVKVATPEMACSRARGGRSAG